MCVRSALVSVGFIQKAMMKKEWKENARNAKIARPVRRAPACRIINDCYAHREERDDFGCPSLSTKGDMLVRTRLMVPTTSVNIRAPSHAHGA